MTQISCSPHWFSLVPNRRGRCCMSRIIEIVLCDRNITELRDILKQKAPKFLPDAEVLLAEMSYELIPAVDHAEKLIRDAKDQPILNAAIVSDVDIILTGDKDFLSLEMEHPKCMTVAQFFESEGVEE